MRVLLLLILIAALSGSILVYGVKLDPGYVMLAWGSHVVEMTAWVFAFSLGLLALALFGLWWFCVRILNIRVRLNRWFGIRSVDQVHTMTARGLAAFEEGHWRRARKLLTKVGDKSENALVFYLLCARASHALGEQEQVTHYLLKASENSSNADMAINLTQAQLQLKDGALEACLATLMRAHALNEVHPKVLEMLARVYKGLKDWLKLSQLLPDLKAERILSAEDYVALEQACYQALLNAAVLDGFSSLDKQWKKMPLHLRSDVIVVETYVDCLLQLDAQDQAESILRKTLSKSLSEGLIHRYGLLQGQNLNEQLLFIQRLVKTHDTSACLLLCAGRLAIACEVWGQAKQYLEHAHSLKPTMAVCLELAHFHLSRGGSESAEAYICQAKQASNT